MGVRHLGPLERQDPNRQTLACRPWTEYGRITTEHLTAFMVIFVQENDRFERHVPAPGEHAVHQSHFGVTKRYSACHLGRAAGLAPPRTPLSRILSGRVRTFARQTRSAPGRTCSTSKAISF